MARLFLALGPLGLFAIVLKVLRLRDHPAGLSVFEGAWLLAPEVLFHGGVFAVAAAGWSMLRGRAWGWGAAWVVAAQVFAVAAVGYLAVAHAFFEITGRSLDWSLVAFTVGRVGETHSVVGSEMTFWRWAQLIGMPLVIGVAPWLVPRLAPALLREREGGAAALLRPPTLLIAGGVLIALSGGPRLDRVDLAFARDPVFHAWTGMIGLGGPEGPGSLGGVLGGGELAGVTVPARPQGATGLREREAAGRPNLVIILLESTRASATTPYKPSLKTTPFMAELAAQSEVVERAYAIIPHTSKALISTLCGIEPRLSFDVVEATPGAMPGRCLADLLGEQGYDTIYFQSATKQYERRVGLIENMGFDKLVAGDDLDHTGWEKANYFGYEDDILLEPTRKWLGERTDESPFFAAYLTNTPHHDYRPPKRYGRPRLAQARQLNKYLQAVRYQDFFLKNLFDLYKEAGVYEDTAFILIGDHGQGFGEHGMWIHDDIMYDEGLRVPLLLHWPKGGVTPARTDMSLSHLDVVPTAIDLLGFDLVDGGYAGGSWRSEPGRRDIRAACYRKFQCLAGIRGARKLIHYFGKKQDELFDLTTDPGEKTSIAADHPEEVAQWRAELLAWKRSVHEMHRPFGESRRRQFVRTKPFRARTELSVTYGDAVRLVGLDAPKARVRRGKRFPVSLHFEALGTPDPGHVELRLSSDEGDRAGVGHVPALGLHPLPEWKAGEFIRDELKPRASRRWKADHVHLCVRLASPGGEALAAEVSDAPGPVDDGCVRIATLRLRSRK